MRNSKIILCSGILMDREYKDVVAYTKQQMVDLIQSKKVVESNTYSFIRETGEILVDFPYATCLSCDYMAYQNPDYENKWFYAWINKVTYKGENSTRIEYTVDQFSTWYTDTSKRQCFVIREHVVDDTIGKHTIPENLQTGEYIIKSRYEISSLQTCNMVLASTTSPRNTDHEDKPIINGVPSGVGYYGYSADFDGSAQLERDIITLVNAGKDNGIVGLFIAPTTLSYVANDGDLIGNSYSPNISTYTITDMAHIDGYTPKNNKCWCYPYCYTLVTNGAGGDMILKPELWNDRSEPKQIQIAGALTVGCSIVAYPLGYGGDAENYDESLPLGKYPTLNWSSDLYVNWCTENALNVQYGIINGLSQATLGPASGNIMGVAQGVETIGQSLYSTMLADRVPAQFRGNLNCGDVNYSAGRITYRIENKCVRNEYIKSIDEFFTRFGYKVNRLKSPNIQNRKVWNYVQIGDGETYVHSGAPSEALDTINACFRKGVTLWHDHDSIGDYSLDNSNRNN